MPYRWQVHIGEASSHRLRGLNLWSSSAIDTTPVSETIIIRVIAHLSLSSTPALCLVPRFLTTLVVECMKPHDSKVPRVIVMKWRTFFRKIDFQEAWEISAAYHNSSFDYIVKHRSRSIVIYSCPCAENHRLRSQGNLPFQLPYSYRYCNEFVFMRFLRPTALKLYGALEQHNNREASWWMWLFSSQFSRYRLNIRYKNANYDNTSSSCIALAF